MAYDGHIAWAAGDAMTTYASLKKFVTVCWVVAGLV